MSTRIDLTGKKLGMLTPLRPTGESTSKGNAIWLCKCDCGNETSKSTAELSRMLSCGCSHRRKGTRSPNFTGCKGISGHHWSEIKGKARKRNILFAITIDYAWEVFEKQSGKCALSGLDLQFKTSNRASDGNASLDRIDSSKGYEQDNVQWVHKDFNRLKSDFDETTFIKMCHAVAKLHPLSNN